MKQNAEHKAKVVVITGPSGSGKTTLRECLLKNKKISKLFVKAVSFTTRKKRTGEHEGKDYFYTTIPQFKRKLKQGQILEWTCYLGSYYGTSSEFIAATLKRGKNILLCLDLKGAKRIRKMFGASAVTFFIKPPTIAELKKRIENRCRETCKKEIIRRLALARKEMLEAPRFDYVIVNKDLQTALRKLKSIILKEAR